MNSYSRFKTRVVEIGNLPMGGNFPVRVQSMTNTDSLDTKSTVEQAIRMIEEGCEYVRIAVPGLKGTRLNFGVENIFNQPYREYLANIPAPARDFIFGLSQEFKW